PKLAAVALDCEMVGVGRAGHDHRSELARLSAIDVITGETLIDTYVKPEEVVTDYRTEFSGISRRTMCEAERNGNLVYGWQAARDALLEFVDVDTILVGHALHNDLKVLRLVHSKIVDSSVLTTEAAWKELRMRRRWGLKRLAMEFVGRDIQEGRGHCSLEDARAAKDVVLACAADPLGMEYWVFGELQPEPKVGDEDYVDYYCTIGVLDPDYIVYY
ncbi:exonuclease, partial [Lasiosphaeria hispida]